VRVKAVSTFGVVAGLTIGSLMLSGQSLAEDRSDVLKRIAPIGWAKTDEGAKAESAPASGEGASETPAAETPAEEPATAEAAPTEQAPEESAEPAQADAGGDASALAQTSGCMACHQVDTKLVGPAYKEVAEKYRGDDGALNMLVSKVKAGGTGTWGEVPMPPNAHIADKDIKTLVTWILSL
jgi:cytochrome c